MKITKSLVVGALLGMSLFACRSGSGNGATPDASSDSGKDSGDGRMHIQDIQNDSMAPGTAVELHGVIVTAIDAFGTKNGQDMWVEEPGGGPFSGVHVFKPPLEQLSKLAVGDIVDITGAVKNEFKLDGALGSVTEVQAPSGGTMTVTRIGVGVVPTPTVVDALAIGQKDQAGRDAEWEKWEGGLITVNNVFAFGQPTCITSKGECKDPTLQQFAITGDLVVESTLAAMPATGLAASACLAGVTGVVDYAFDYAIFPRTTAEIGLNGASCPAKESSAAVCGDGIDNDGNGFKDCDDNACVVVASACRSVSTIAAIQSATPAGPIELADVYVTAVAANKKSFWVSTTATPSKHEGVFVFRSSAATDLEATVVPGAKVDVIGKVIEFNDDPTGGTLTEVSALQVTVAAGAPIALGPVETQTATALLETANAADYESVLVTLTNVKLTAIGTAANGSIATGTQGGKTFGVATDVVALTSENLGCYASITGLWTNLEAPGAAATTKPNAFGFIPVTLAGKDEGSCN
jgi:hypothetical protein